MKAASKCGLTIAFLAALVGGCSAERTSYVIQGDVSGVTETGVAKLTQVVHVDGKRDRIDIASAEILDGEFRIEGRIEAPAYMRVQVEVDEKVQDYAYVIVEPGADIDVAYYGEIPGIWADGTGTHKELLSGYRFSEDYVAAMNEYTQVLLHSRSLRELIEPEVDIDDDSHVAEDGDGIEESPAEVASGTADTVDKAETDDAASEAEGDIELVTEAATEELDRLGGVPGLELRKEAIEVELDRVTIRAGEAYAKLGEAKVAFLSPFAEQNEDPELALLAIEAGGSQRDQTTIERLTELGEMLPAATKEMRIDPAIASIEAHLVRVEANEALVVGESVQDFTLPTLGGDEHNLFATLGENEYVLVDFWASWCGPCIAQFPDLKEVYESHSDGGFQVVNVSLDEKREDWERASAEQELPWVDVGDMLAFNSQTAKAFGVTFIPKGYLVNSEGVIVAKDVSMDDLDSFLLENLGQEAAADQEATEPPA